LPLVVAHDVREFFVLLKCSREGRFTSYAHFVEQDFSKKIWRRSALAYLCNPIRNKASQNASHRISSLQRGQASTPKKQERSSRKSGCRTLKKATENFGVNNTTCIFAVRSKKFD
jgi:hypothetical protein